MKRVEKHKSPKLLKTFDELWSLIDYWQKGRTAREISCVMNASELTVKRRLKALDLKALTLEEAKERRDADKLMVWAKAMPW